MLKILLLLFNFVSPIHWPVPVGFNVITFFSDQLPSVPSLGILQNGKSLNWGDQKSFGIEKEFCGLLPMVFETFQKNLSRSHRFHLRYATLTGLTLCSCFRSSLMEIVWKRMTFYCEISTMTFINNLCSYILLKKLILLFRVIIDACCKLKF